jgi:cytochrome c oxidase cbb3-type subunit 4
MTFQDVREISAHAGLFYFIAIFAVVLIYALRPSARKKFEDAARIPLDEK